MKKFLIIICTMYLLYVSLKSSVWYESPCMCFAVHHHLRNDEVIWRKFPSSSVYRKVVPRSNHSIRAPVHRLAFWGPAEDRSAEKAPSQLVSRPSVVCCCPSLGGPEASGVEQRGAVTGQRNDNTGDDNISSRSNKTVASDLNLGALLVTKESSDVIE